MTNDVASSEFLAIGQRGKEDTHLNAVCSIPWIPTVTTSPATQNSELLSEAMARCKPSDDVVSHTSYSSTISPGF
jgi:hypothetical protein